MSISFTDPFTKKSLVLMADGLGDGHTIKFPRIKGAYRVAGGDNYTDNFGYQWNKFAKTQIDRESASSGQSKLRFFAETNWDKEDLTDKNILEVGSGAGRFSQIVLDHTKAVLYSVDYSNAVEANFKNNGHHGERLKLFQASIYDLPFEPDSFDKVLCLGVLQHTPDFRKSLESLVAMLKPGGELVVDFYAIRGWWTKIHVKYMLRPFTKRMSNERLLRLIEKNIGWMIKAHFFFNKIGVGKIFNRFLPICDIKATLPPNLSKEELRQWCILDTFDMFSPEYDRPQRISTVKKWVKELGLKNIFAQEVFFDNCTAAVVKGVK
jgi:SAM-dependent methyltransferase